MPIKWLALGPDQIASRVAGPYRAFGRWSSRIVQAALKSGHHLRDRDVAWPPGSLRDARTARGLGRLTARCSPQEP